jgi:hypothetical protein
MDHALTRAPAVEQRRGAILYAPHVVAQAVLQLATQLTTASMPSSSGCQPRRSQASRNPPRSVRGGNAPRAAEASSGAHDITTGGVPTPGMPDQPISAVTTRASRVKNDMRASGRAPPFRYQIRSSRPSSRS